MPAVVAGTHRRMWSRPLLRSAWAVPMTSPVTAPPASADSGSSTRPATPVPASPARGKARNPAVQTDQVRRNDGGDAAVRVMGVSSSSWSRRGGGGGTARGGPRPEPPGEGGAERAQGGPRGGGRRG